MKNTAKYIKDKVYTYADLEKIDDENRYEIIDGKL